MQKTISLASILLCALILFAADNYKPLNVKTGLWEVTVTHVASETPPIPPDMQARLAQMTPEQRARVEEMIRSRFGGTPQANTYKKCVTSKDLNTNPWANQGNENCAWTVVTSTASDLEVHGSSCAAGRNQGMKSEVNIRFHALDPENVKASMQGSSTGNGQTMNMSGTYTGKWISATCPAGTD